jgi:hypothetical protein
MPQEQDNALTRLNTLPKDVQEAIFAEETANAIYETAEKERVLPNVSVLAEITGDVMLGMLPIAKFREGIQIGLGVDEQKARRIAEQIRDKVFQKIAQSLRKIHNLK